MNEIQIKTKENELSIDNLNNVKSQLEDLSLITEKLNVQIIPTWEDILE